MNPRFLYPTIAILALAALLAGSYSEYHNEFQQWCQKYSMSFTSDEYAYRASVFKSTLEEIALHNAKY